jgi:hypothetical protein
VQILSNLKQYILTTLLAISIILFSSEIYCQNNLRIFEDYGGGSGSSSSQSSNSNDNTFIYVAGGLLVAGVLVYALVLNKDKKTESDTTASLNSKLIYSDNNGYRTIDEQINNIKEKIPVDIFLGVKNSSAFLNDKTYLVGLRLKL